MPVSSPLRIVHCLRAPIGGLFRHVHDLAKGQAELGADVGIVCDSRTGDPEADGRLADNCTLGVTRMPMSRHIGLGDGAPTAKHAARRKLEVDVLHGHGAKGGAYARLAGRKLKRKGKKVKAVYTPHGGSLHYSPSRPMGRLYIMAERMLVPLTDGLSSKAPSPRTVMSS